MKEEYSMKPSFQITAIGILINMLFIWIAKIIKLPIYLDCIGTIVSAILGGMLPGIATGFFSNCLGTMLSVSEDPMTMYYGFLNVFIGIITVWFNKKNYFSNWKGRIKAVLCYALVGGGFGSIVSWLLYGFSFGYGVTRPLVILMDRYLKFSPFVSQFIGDVASDIVDKLLSVIIALIIIKLLPESLKPKEEVKDNEFLKKSSIKTKVIGLVISSAGLISIIAIFVGTFNFVQEIYSISSITGSLTPEQIKIKIAVFFIHMLSMIFGFMILVMAVSVWYCNRFLLEPISILAEKARKMSYEGKNKDKNATNQDVVKTGDELEEIFRILCHTEDKMESYIIKMKEKNHEISKMQRNIIFTLANMVENRDENTGGHIKRTANYVRMIGKRLKKNQIFPDIMTQKYVRRLYDSAPLHDIGKIKIPDSILNKPGKLTDEEFDIMKSHTTEGALLLQISLNEIEDESWLSMAVDMALCHHERWDGRGYPNGLKQYEIPLCARIMAVADVFDALVSERSYKKAFTYEQALKIIEEGAGTQFDPDIVDAFLQSQDEIKKIMNQK